MSYRKFLVLSSILFFSCEEKKINEVADFQTHFETSQGQETATYLEAIDFYVQLAKEFSSINIQTIGETDSGNPLHIVTYNKDASFNFQKIGENKIVILINNGIHPGESDGIDATMLLYRDMATGKLESPENTVLVTIPIYNIGGALNRNSATRANQNGPKSYGFRGNAKNYDLNRDFIKSDTKNARSFAKIFHLVKPDIFIDNHVSNGADYQYTLTHLFTQHNKLGGDLGQYLNKEMMPKLEDFLAKEDWSITPYVNVFNQRPESGFSQFIDHSRYSTGYTTLWNTLGLMVETHMLKPYAQRVEGTYQLMKQVINIAEIDGVKIKELRKTASTQHKNWSNYPVQWAVDTTKFSVLNFKGFEADTLKSKVTGFTRLKYDRDRPFTKEVIYQDYYRPIDSVTVPKAYIIKKGYDEIIDLFELNQIVYETLEKDTLLNVESYKINDYSTLNSAYEGHYLHYNTSVNAKHTQLLFSKGDFIVFTDQAGFRYIMETLEPSATDSFFNWNFFDTILQEKEDFSPYVFEDEAEEMLKKDSILKKEFDRLKASDSKFALNWYAQLDYIFKKSEHYETAHMQYPVYRIMKDVAAVKN